MFFRPFLPQRHRKFASQQGPKPWGGEEGHSKAVNRDWGWDADADTALVTTTKAGRQTNYVVAHALPTPTHALGVHLGLHAQGAASEPKLSLVAYFAKIHMELSVNADATVVP